MGVLSSIFGGGGGQKVGEAYVEMRADPSHVRDDIHSGFKSAFSGLGGILGPLLGELGPLEPAIDKIGDAFQRGGDKGSYFGKVLFGLGAGLTGLGLLGTKIAEPFEKAEALLKNAVENSGHTLDQFSGQIDKTVSKMEGFGHTASDTDSALAKMTYAFGDPNKALNEMQVVADLAARRHISLAAAAQMAVQVFGGNTRIMKQLGIDTAAAGLSTESLTQAQQRSATASQHLQDVQQRLADFEERRSAQRQAAQEAYTQKVESANDRVTSSETTLADLRQRLDADVAAAAERYAEQEAAATQRVEDATRSLMQAKEDAARQAMRDSEDAAASQAQDEQSIQDAIQRRSDYQEQQKAKGNPYLTAQVNEAIRQRQLEEDIKRARDKAATDAHKMAEKLADDQRRSEETIRRAQEVLDKANQDKAKLDEQAGTIGVLNAQQQTELARAEKSVVDAHEKLRQVLAQGVGGNAIAEAQQERKLHDELAKAKADDADAAAKERAAAEGGNQRLAILNDKTQKQNRGAAKATADTWAGHLDTIRAKIVDVASRGGASFGQLLVTAGPALAGLGGLAELHVLKKLKSIGPIITDGVLPMIGKFGASLAEMGLALATNPIFLIVLAITALVAAFIYAYTHSERFRAVVQAVLGAVGNAAKAVIGFFVDLGSTVVDKVGGALSWLGEHWPLILAILTGPIGLAVLFIIDHWQQIMDGIDAVGRFIADVFSTAYDDIVKPIGSALSWLWNAFTSLPGDLANILGGIWDFLWNGLKVVINDILGGIEWMIRGLAKTLNGTVIRFINIVNPFADVPKFPEDISLPRLAEGGIVKARPGGTRAVLGEAGEDEVVAPLSEFRKMIGAGGGPGRGGEYHFHFPNYVGDKRELAQLISSELRALAREAS